MKKGTTQIARQVFEEIQERFPNLEMIEDIDMPLVDISITIPPQSGLKQKIWLGFQNNDELHFTVGNFWLEWFPCTDSNRVEEYIEAVSGYILGYNRVLEHYRGNTCVKAELQTQISNGQWKTIGTWSRFWINFFKNKTYKEVKNT